MENSKPPLESEGVDLALVETNEVALDIGVEESEQTGPLTLEKQIEKALEPGKSNYMMISIGCSFV